MKVKFSNRYFALVLVIILSFTGFGQVMTPFAIVHQTMQPGGIVYLANASIGCSANPPFSSVSSCSNGVNQMPPGGTFKDNDFNAAYIDIDGDASTFMSSSDALNLPVCSQITRAILFWGATGATTSSLTTCKMKVNGGSYQPITAVYTETNNTGFNTYHNYADVTNLVAPGGRQATVTVADIPSNQIGTSNRFGSWCIAVFYKNDLLPLRQLTVFRGLGNVSGTATVTIPISGFLTPPVGPVGIQLGVYVHDGDRSFTGDDISFRGAASTAGSFVAITDAVNPSSDVMNSTVSFGGTLTPNRVPNMNNTGGLDADIYLPDNSAKIYVGNSATSGTFQLTTGSETYLPQMVTTVIDVYEPDVRAAIRARDVNGGSLVPGDIVEYTMKGLNVGSDPSVNTFITDTLDIRAEYIPNSTRIIYGPGTGTLTDAAGDDRLDYNSTTKTLKVRIGTGANAVIGGTVNNSSTGIDSTVVTYSVMCTSSCIKIACSPTISAQAYIWATGAISSNTFNNGSNPGIFDGSGCPIPGTTKTPITATACTVPTASNTGPGCEFGTVFLSSPPDPSVVYNWSGPSSFTSSLQNPTLTPVTAAMAGVYTVTLSVPSSTCKAVLTTTLVTAVCTPTAVNDATITPINTPVSGNVSTNDLNANGATFSVSTQPPSGTVTMNPNGQFTFTPAPSFTGVTTATYAVCLGTNCASGQVSFTVHPIVIANTDAVITTPSVSTSGNLLTNDAGITSTLGATYSVSITQPLPTTGTFVLNPSTGQYTFTPNPAFSGTATTTYTVCNTAVIPAVCSSTNINIVVAGPPLSVADVTNTMQGVSVSGSLGANDNNVGASLNPTFTVTQPPSGTGTISINAANGQYTFTPNPAFTGTGSTTYTVCNITGSCSSTTFSFNVFPTLSAINDVNSTAPGTPTTGNLLTNDGGGTASGATYTVSVTQLPTGTGTIIVNPANGQYTFTPNPAFGGTTSTTYTVCNTAVTPSVCSSAVISLTVAGPPLAVPDATNTMQGVAVNGSIGTNDSGVSAALSPTFTITQLPSGTGTITLNPATGQYTFAPNPTFTGTTSTTYTVCNITGSCSSTTFSFDVFPTLVANSNSATTTPSVSTTGSLLTNDAGIVTNATYSVIVTQLGAGTGTVTVNPATGQYTFTPNPSFTGTTSTTYTVCNTSVNPVVCSSALITLTVAGAPLAVTDSTNTIQGVSVNGTIGGNDLNTNPAQNPTFTVTQPSSGTGTFVLIPGTGQYTFIPNPSFTGTASTTYTVCNMTGSCSSSNINITVYPTLVANQDVIATTPSVTTNGTLITNDLGIVPGGTYSISVTQPSASVGTISVNSATGQYTFVPNPSYTGTTSTTYTICNTSVNPVVCTNTTIIIRVGNFASATPDFTATVINTQVSGSVAGNDNGTLSSLNPAFTNSQPLAGTGTLVMNPTTGQYTFTPSTGFTGTTSATYTLCNVLSPPCSTTTVTFTIFPALATNSDVVVTTPSTTTTGTLLTNDLGIAAGGIYTVSVTQPASGTGTIILNPATGQYTFVPNPSFTGTASTTYTVCNTAVTPSVCSTNTIVIQVGTPPVAASDFTATPINTPVSGSAGGNDSGTLLALNPSFTNSQPLSGTGSLVMNPTTGQYTFTPATGFTGTTSATYTLCNVLSPPCSTTTITFTVFPALATNSDVVVTTPSTTITGTLLTNDLGIAPGGIYTVSVTQPASGTGTITLNPATGQYTFVPNPSFTGTSSTTYTVCNTAVTPSVCSTNTILIQVGTPPVATPDFSTTIINTPVTGNLSTNDTGTLSALSPVYTASQPLSGTGTLAVNPSSGQYTYTPATGFTGTTSATYTLCNVLSPPCSTTTITFSVYPAIVTNSDVVNTTPSVSVNGSLLPNDLGIVNSASLSANYSVFISQPSPTVGTFVIDPATGQYTFTPNPGFVGTAQTTYTLCNNSVIPSVCSSTVIAINVFPNPAPVNDATTTVVNTPVIGNAAGNDGGTAGGTFNITGQPANGTVTIDPATGQYTFVPAPGFTGVTSATYNLCNGAPVTCSPAIITVTVYPLIASNNDTVITTPTASATGNLLSNDNGIIAGGVYTVSITQPPSNTGTFVINPSTGQYTFTPNPGFTGTTSATYTVCNISVTPSICSTSTIMITVGDYPMAVNDGTVTTQGVTVSGSAASNDIGANSSLNPSYSIGLMNPSHGTVTINPSTGQYTFVPHSGFTGTTSVTYTLCNVLSPPCSSATIVFTVIPALIANNDFISTSSSVTVNGNLLQNDNGISTSGIYTVTATPVNPSTGTLTVDPATGNYTFVPNPSFTGSVTTTYTVCNIAVTPVVCSTATITINVNNAPVAVADGTVTVQGVSVSGNAAGNDAGANQALNPVFTVGSMPAGTGSIVMNPATGQYTFTPLPGFTGTTSVTYTLCNLNSPPCSTTTITFTVYPSITANQDVIATTPSVTVYGNIVTNDAGVVPGGTYSITVTQPPATTGTLVVNQSTGQYTFIPHPNYTGTTTTTYTVCNVAVMPVVCSTSTITIIVGNGPIANSDGTVTPQGVPVSGSAAGNDVGVLSSLNPTFTIGSMSPTVGTISMNPATGQYTFTPASGFTGTASVTYVLCNIASPPCATTTINFTVFPTLVANPTLVITTPTASVAGTLSIAGNSLTPGGSYNFSVTPIPASTGTLIINSSTGQYTFIPNPNYTGTTVTTYTVCNNAVNPVVCSSSSITIIVVNNPAKIGIAKSASKVVPEANGCNLVTFKFTIKNHGTDTAYQIEAFDNLDATFGNNATYNIVSAPLSVNNLLKPNTQFTGNGTGTNLLLASNKLGAGKADTILVQVRYCPSNSVFSFNNTATVSASNLPSGGTKTTDVSNNGLNPDPNNNNNPSDPGEDSPTTFGSDPVVFVPQGFSPNSDGVNDVMKVRGLEPYPNNELTILNRWGNVVYKKKVYDNSWDGTSNQGVTYGDNTLPEGTYFYIMDLGEGNKPVKGYIYLSRSLTK